MGAVAERFDTRASAAAERDSVAGFEVVAGGPLDGDAVGDPEGTVGDHADLGGDVGLIGDAIKRVGQRTRRTVFDHRDHFGAFFRISGLVSELPDVSRSACAHADMGTDSAEVLDVGALAGEMPGVVGIRSRRVVGRVPLDLRVGPITERLVR